MYQTLSFYLTISAIASLLSDTFVRWKGIFWDGLTFYHQFVREPLHEIFLDFKLDLVPELIDFVVIYALLVSAFIRLRFVEIKNNLKVNWKLTFNLFLGIAFVAMFCVLGTAQAFKPWPIFSLQIFQILLLTHDLGRQQKIAFYIPLLCAISAVGIMVVINRE